MYRRLTALQHVLMSEHARQLAQQFRDELQSPFSSLEELCRVLVAPLHAFNLTRPTTYAEYNPEDNAWLQLDAQDKSYILKVYWAQFQEILATKITIDWLHELRRAHLDSDLWIPFFCPHKISAYATSIARLSLSSLLSILANKPIGQNLSTTSQKGKPLPEFVRNTSTILLEQLTQQFSLLDYIRDIYSSSSRPGEALLEWQAFVDVYLSIPARISNASNNGIRPPQILEWRMYYVSASCQLEDLIHGVSITEQSAPYTDALTYTLAKMARSGFMTFERSQRTFWSAVMPRLRSRLLSQCCEMRPVQLWQEISTSLSAGDFRTFVLGLLSALEESLAKEGTSKNIKRASMLLERIIGLVRDQNDRIFAVAIRGVFLSRAWDSTIARVLVSWSMNSDQTGTTASNKLLQDCLELWAEKDVIERAPVAYHTYLTQIVLLVIRNTPSLDKDLVDMSRSGPFLRAITAHLSTMREIVRLQGMLVAEEVSKKSLSANGPIKPLDFGDIWEADSPSYVKIRDLKDWLDASKDDIKAIDWELPKEEQGIVEDADTHDQQKPTPSTLPRDSSRKDRSAPSTRKTKGSGLIQVIDESSEFDDYDEVDEPDLEPYKLPPKPAANDLKDIEDLSAYTPEKKKAKPPVYIPDLCAYLKSDDANKLDVGLKEAACLIRRKAQWGTELADAAIELAHVLSGLQDNFSLDHFEERRRQALTALMASAPERAAPAVIEQFFSNQYSIHQKTTMLASLAFGARELAGMPALIASANKVATDNFPTRRLPGKLHDRFIKNDKSSDIVGKELELLTEDITNMALSRTRESAEGQIPEASKEKLLTVRQTRQKVTPLATPEKPVDEFKYPAYNELAVNTFVMPLLNRFWLYLRDLATSPQDFRSGIFKGGSAGSATMLEPMLLSKFVSTITILVDSARHSPHFLAVLAPEALELVLAIRGLNAEDETVQTSMLQLTLAVLDASISVDAGRTLAREQSKALWEIKDWAEGVWTKTEGGDVGAEGRAAAGVLLRIDTVVQKTIGYV